MSAPRATTPLLLAGLLAGSVLVACGTGGAPAGSGTAAPEPSSIAVTPLSAAPASRVAGRIVVLDPGHNGGNGAARAAINRQVPDGRGGTKACNTTGTATTAGYPEHAFTWDVALRVRSALEAQGVHVILTRTSDDGVGPCVDVRGAAGRQAGADAVVSIHADGSAAANSGFHVAYSAPPLNAAQAGPSVTLSRDLRDALRGAGFPPSDYIGTAGLSARPDLAGLNLSSVPTALVECANMRNPGEAARVSSPEGRDGYAKAITAGILAFLGRAG